VTEQAATTRRAQQRRISYFMLFRLAMLAVFTAIVGVLLYADEQGFGGGYTTFVIATLVCGYVLTIIWARMLPRVLDLGRFAAVQTAADIALTAVLVAMSGGVDSGFATLYLIAILGAATMGGPRHTWVAASACALVYLTMSALELAQIVVPFTSRGPAPPLLPRELLATVARTMAALVGLAVLASYLSAQLRTSVTEVGKLRALNDHIVRSLSSGLVTVDRQGRLAYFNPAARAILDLADEQIGAPLDEVFPGLTPLGDERGDARLESDLVTHKGRRIHVGLSRVPLVDAHGTRVGYVVNFQDLTKLHELAQRVRRSERLAALGGLAASVAHEIRNPLAAISGSAELLGGSSLGDEDQKLLAIIKRESSRLSEVVADLLAFTRPRKPEPVRIDLTTSVREACEAFRADPGNAALQLECHGEGGIAVEVDPAQLAQVLWNLLRNAAEATGGEGKVDVTIEADEEDARVVVRDDGPGIAASDVEKIFDPFFTTKEEGTGFGLAIVHRVVGDNGGTVRVASAPGKGATFTVEFPRAKAERPDASGVFTLPA
jgi:two-component system sensor histidine kinase PilS (NtrC family)